MTEDEHLAVPGPRKPLVEWLPTGRTEDGAVAFGAFAVGLIVGALLIGGAVYGRQRLRR